MLAHIQKEAFTQVWQHAKRTRARFGQSACFFNKQQKKRIQGIHVPVIEMVIAFSLSATMSHVQLIIISFKVDPDVIQNKTMPQRWTWKDACLLSGSAERGVLLRLVLNLEADKNALDKGAKMYFGSWQDWKMTKLWLPIYDFNTKLRAKLHVSLLNEYIFQYIEVILYRNCQLWSINSSVKWRLRGITSVWVHTIGKSCTVQ